jgi:cytochrome c biogenesis protein CcmG, thiol:disulfide interchange protein DsbE
VVRTLSAMAARGKPSRLAAAAGVLACMSLCACGANGGPRQTSHPTTGPQPASLLFRQAGMLLTGGPPAFRAQLSALRGTPVVVNQWASWCGPCRFEFPFFARLAQRYRGRVAFLGVDAQDSQAAAMRFLHLYRTPYPHFFDPSTSIARQFRAGFAWPTTAFYDAAGKLSYTHAGGYSSQSALDRDIRRYALRPGG